MIYLRLLPILFLFASIKIVYTQSFLKSYGGLYNDEALDVETDAAGNIYTTGYITSSASYGFSSNVNTNGYSDVFVTKSDPNGNVIWVKVFGGPQADRGYDIELDGAGNIYVTGYFMGNANFDGINISANAGSRDAFVMKLDNNGVIQWVNNDGGPEGDTGYGVNVDGNGNVIYTGQFKGQGNIAGSIYNSALDPNTGLPSYDVFIAKYDANGTPLWSHQAIAPFDDRGLSVAIDANNKIYVSGQFSDTLTVAGYTQNNTVFNAGFVIKFDDAGTLEFFQRLSAYQTLINDIMVNANNDLYLTGDFLGQMIILDQNGYNYITGNYTYRIFVIKMDDHGNLIWAEADGSDSEISSQAIAIDGNDDTYITGMFKCMFNDYNDTTAEEGLFNSVGFRDIFLAKYSSSGDRLYQAHYGGPRDDYAGGIAINQVDHPIIAGGFDEYFSFPANGSLPLTTHQSFETNSFCTGQNYVLTHAEGARDIFVGDILNTTFPNYYYYNSSSCYDTLTPCVGWGGCQDTLEFCDEGALFSNTYTNGNGVYEPNKPLHLWGHIGPFFNRSWSNGDTVQQTTINSTGWYTCELSRIDGCESYMDSTYVIIHPIPDLPAMNDSVGFNNNTFPAYNTINVCYPDSAYIWPSFVDTNTIVAITLPNGITYTDSLPHGTNVEGTIEVLVTDTNGCSLYDDYELEVHTPFVLDTIVPYLTLIDPVDNNDSINICLGDEITVVLMDSLTNPTGNLNSPYCGIITTEIWSTSGLTNHPSNDSIPQCPESIIYPTTSGWYHFNLDIALGYDNYCGIDTTWYEASDSFYVHVDSLPEFSLNMFGNLQICPGDTTSLWVDTTITGFTWSGPSILSTSTNGDLIIVNAIGNYTYGGVFTDPLTGCTANISESSQVVHKDDPEIISNVPDNIICPNDSILLTCITPAATYDWIGPFGNSIGNSSTIWASVPGYYHCVIVDNDSCVLTSNTIEIKEYNTPFLIAEPGTELCHSGNIELTIIHTGSPVFNWLPPVSSTSSSIVVSDPGTYICEISQCGFTITDSIVITQSTISANITVLPDTIICPGDTVNLIANSGMSSYEWSNGSAGQQALITQDGAYAVTVYDNSGCSATSDSVYIYFHPGSGPPEVVDTTICLGDTLELFNSNGQYTEWFASASDTIPVDTGAYFIMNNITSDTSIYVSSSNGICTTSLLEVNISVSQVSIPSTIAGDSVYCHMDTIALTGPNIPGAVYNWTNPNGINSSNPYYIIANASQNDTGYYHLNISDQFCSQTLDSFYVDVYQANPFNLSVTDTVYKCTLDTIAITSSIGDTVLWQPSGTSDISIDIANPSQVWATSIDLNGCTSFSDTITVLNYNVQMPTITGPSTLCFGDTAVISSINGDSLYWYSTDSSLITFGQDLIVGPLSTDTAFLGVYIDSNGCIAPSVAHLITVIPANGAPNIYGDTVLCEGEILNLSTDIISGATYNWSAPSIPTTSNTNIFTYGPVAPSMSGQVQLTVNGNGCITSPATVNITVNPLPAAAIISGDTLYCDGDSLNINANHADVYWLDGFGNLLDSGQVLSIPNLSIMHTGTYYATSFDPLTGCIGLPSPVNIYVNPTPLANNVYPGTAFCLGADAYLYSGNSSDSLIWTTPIGSNYYGDTLELNGVNGSDSGLYYVETINSFGCSTLDSILVQPDSIPLVNLGPDLILCDDSTHTINLDPNLSTIIWQDGSALSSYIISDSGQYYVDVYSSGGCHASDTIEVQLVNCAVHIPNIITANSDGVNDYLIIENLSSDNYIVIYNRWGRIMFETEDYQNDWSGQNCEPGVYYYILFPYGRSGNNPEVRKGFIELIK